VDAALLELPLDFERAVRGDLRGVFLESLARLDPVPGTYKLVSIGAKDPLFVVSGAIDSDGPAVIDYAARIDDLDLERTRPDASGGYALVFVNEGGSETGRLPFAPQFHDAHTGSEGRGVTGIFLVTALPAASSGFEVRVGGRVLASRKFTSRPPEFRRVDLAAADVSHLRLAWDASDADGDDLTFGIFFEAEPGTTPQLLAAGLHDSSFDFSTALAPASASAHLIVEASDGYNTARARSASFTIAPRPPVVVISAPVAGAALFAGEPVELAATAFDYTAGLLDSNGLEWTSDRQGRLGTGDTVGVDLIEGDHVLTVTGRAPSGLTASRSVNVTIRPASERPPVQPVGPTRDALIDLGRCRRARVETVATPAGLEPGPFALSTDSPWLRAESSDPGRVRVAVDCAPLPDGRYTGQVIVSAAGARLAVIEVGFEKGAPGVRPIRDSIEIALGALALASVLGWAAVTLARGRGRGRRRVA